LTDQFSVAPKNAITFAHLSVSMSTKLASGGVLLLAAVVEAWIQQPETPTLVGVELGACSARRFNSPYVETNAPHSAHTTG
jgi:hypothetical protein